MKTQERINKNYLPALSKVFTPVVMDSLISKGTSAYLNEIVNNSGLIGILDTSMTLKDFFDWLYNFLIKNYRNEYIYKNAIANKILLGKHSLNTSHMLTEFRVAKCKADVVILNGTSTVYEIKSEYDSFNRLENQIDSYLKVFDHINVITSELQSTKIQTLLPENIGIMVLTNKNTIKTVRESEGNKKNINTEVLFDSLRKNEYTCIVKEFYGEVPKVPNTQIYKACKKLFCDLTVENAHDLTIKHLRKRGSGEMLNDFINRSPSSLIAYVLSISSNKKKAKGLISLFDNKIESILTPTQP